jgi:nucleoside-diphosphate-sugar epimerase
VLHGDIRDRGSVEAALGSMTFDVVVDFIAFEPTHVESDIDFFGGRTGQYVFISSASAYQTPAATLPITESTPLSNPFWAYSRAKIACEGVLERAWRDTGFPMTIVRPSHTYDEAALPVYGRYTAVDRMRNGRKIIVQGDGTSLWVLTHSRDFAKGFVGLLGNRDALGEAFHITSDEWLTWNQIYGMVADAAGATADIVHIPSDVIAEFDAEWGAGMLGDKGNSTIFDNTKIKGLAPGFVATIPFERGAAEVIEWHDADPARRTVDAALDAVMDRLADRFHVGR